MTNRIMSSLRFMREHRWTSSHLSEYIDQELSVPERRRIEEHAGLCPHCHRMLATLRRTVSGLRSLGSPAQPPAGDGLTEAVLSRFREEAERR